MREEDVSDNNEEAPGQDQENEIWQWDKLAMLTAHREFLALMICENLKETVFQNSMQICACSTHSALRGPDKARETTRKNLLIPGTFNVSPVS